MLSSKLLKKKKTIKNKVGQFVTDLIYGTFKFPTEAQSSGIVLVNEFESMRPDLVAHRIYGDQSKWDVLLKYNAISNPFSIQTNDFMYAIPYSVAESMYKNPTVISDRGEKDEILVDTNRRVDPNAGKDKNRLDNLATKGPGGALPPNISKEGDKSVKVRDGKLIFGEDVTTINKANCPVPISRSRLQKALIKDRLFL